MTIQDLIKYELIFMANIPIYYMKGIANDFL